MLKPPIPGPKPIHKTCGSTTTLVEHNTATVRTHTCCKSDKLTSDLRNNWRRHTDNSTGASTCRYVSPAPTQQPKEASSRERDNYCTLQLPCPIRTSQLLYAPATVSNPNETTIARSSYRVQSDAPELLNTTYCSHR